ncbi:uncharacterized protein C8Q71DRAFT_734228 [Rhodofomes roseus]|uniref:Mitochondrial outer membrane transport complex Sam37/metaxin N-terminal domain-containing protein n=1 Tax=Rhodofomes roseus TaxID=34475 RepID=A0ABQ8KUT2_9APHY|nr:uncharacterized protein C8Q71DRAFT_734228 [Rhodofomes roseus]KAH9842744.1 hypothetical protein C8Q71DRAFT_734228 [Rhodofomes roseus]
MSHPSSSAPAGTQITLYIWPPHENVLSLNAASVAALFYTQLAIPGQFSVAYSANPDSSPSGQLPYLTHGMHNATTFASIAKYVTQLPGARDVNESLNTMEKSQFAARIAHVQSDYGDLVAHMLYSLRLNWRRVTRPAMASMLPVPQRYYVPNRIRESYQPRLEAAELWDIPGIEQEEEEDRISALRRDRRKKKETKAQKFKRVFEREKVIEKARAFLSSYATLLGERRYFNPHADSPSALDIVFAAHTHILMNVSFADPLLQGLLSESYPTLVAHAQAVQSVAFPDPQSFPPTAPLDLSPSLKSLLPTPALPSWPWTKRTEEVTEEEKRFRLARWGWIGLAAASVVFYLAFLNPVVVVVSRDEDDEVDEDAEEEEEHEDEEEDTEEEEREESG